MSQSAYTLNSGSILVHNDTKFTIESVLGAGGFGITYKAVYEKEIEIEEQYQSIKTVAKVPVAIKELFLEGKCVRSGDQTVSLQSLGEEEFGQFKNRFLQEAQTLSKFNRAPGLLHVISYFENNNTAYMVTEYVEGKTLRELVNESGNLAESTALDYITKLAKALIPVHEEGLLHRDIKPDNIIITPNDQSVLIDFGAAREFVAETTITNSVILTPGYAPVEQYGQRKRRGPYTDIYALGATLFFCLTGKKPDAIFDREPGETVKIQGASEKINAILRKTMAYKGEDRYQTSQEFVNAIEGNAGLDTVIRPNEEELMEPDILDEELEDLIDNDTQIREEESDDSSAGQNSGLVFNGVLFSKQFVIFLLVLNAFGIFFASWDGIVVGVIFYFVSTILSALPLIRNKEPKLLNYLGIGFFLPASFAALYVFSSDDFIVGYLLFTHTFFALLIFIAYLKITSDFTSGLFFSLVVFCLAYISPVSEGSNGLGAASFTLLANDWPFILYFPNVTFIAIFIILIRKEVFVYKEFIVVGSIISIFLTGYWTFPADSDFEFKSYDIGYYLWWFAQVILYADAFFRVFKLKKA